MQNVPHPGPQTMAPVIAAKPRWLVPALMLLAVFIGYAYTLTFAFVYDDQAQIVTTSYVHSWRFVPSYFQEHIWSHKISGGGSYYRPVFLLWLLINYTLFGLRPEWWHLTTAGLHLTATLLVYRITLRLTRDTLVAAIAALVFGLHPVHVESVAWISGVSDPLVAVLVLASFLCYLRGAGFRAASLGLYGLALLAKEPAVALPPLIFAHAWIFSSAGGMRARLRNSLTVAAPYLALVALYSIARVIVLHNFGAVSNPLPLRTLLYTLPGLLWFYVRHLIWPAELSLVYNFSVIDRADFWNFAVPGLLITAIASSLYAWARRSRLAAFASVWLLATLLPVLNLRYLAAADVVHDRYLYLPSMGFCLLVAVAVRRSRFGQAPSFLIAIACVMLTATVAQSRYWANNLTLFRHANAVAPDNPIALYSLGTELLDMGMRDDALPVFQRLYDLYPQTFNGNFGLGAWYYHEDQLDLAGKYLSRALELRRADATALVLLGLTRVKQGRLDEGESYVRQAIKVQRMDGYELYHAQLGYVLKLKGDLDAALHEFRLEQTHFPDSPGLSQEIAETEQRLRSR